MMSPIQAGMLCSTLQASSMTSMIQTWGRHEKRGQTSTNLICHLPQPWCTLLPMCSCNVSSMPCTHLARTGLVWRTYLGSGA